MLRRLIVYGCLLVVVLGIVFGPQFYLNRHHEMNPSDTISQSQYERVTAYLDQSSSRKYYRSARVVQNNRYLIAVEVTGPFSVLEAINEVYLGFHMRKAEYVIIQDLE